MRKNKKLIRAPPGIGKGEKTRYWSGKKSTKVRKEMELAGGNANGE
jgi:hypothetical protein